MVDDPAHFFTAYHEKYTTHIRSHVYGEESELAKNIIAYYTSSLYLYCWGDVMLCGKETLVVNEKPFDQKEITQFSKDVLKGKFFVFG